MKLVHAVWEQRNLGLSVYEAEVMAGDTPDSISAQLSELTDVDYICVKVPIPEAHLTPTLEEQGFRFREMLSTVEVTKLPALDSLQQRYASALKAAPATDTERAETFRHIRDGLFSTDRYSLDAQFTAEQAANRYCGWIGDELDRGGVLHAISFKGKFVGFFLVREMGTKRYSSLLAAIFPAYQNMGLGYFINHMAYAHCFSIGATAVSTTYSSNNLSAANIHCHLSTRLLSQVYVYTKHG
ncbi:MAG: hypothetical protein AAGJ09_09950 [Pseudomonadota bacterium]